MIGQKNSDFLAERMLEHLIGQDFREFLAEGVLGAGTCAIHRGNLRRL